MRFYLQNQLFIRSEVKGATCCRNSIATKCSNWRFVMTLLALPGGPPYDAAMPSASPNDHSKLGTLFWWLSLLTAMFSSAAQAGPVFDRLSGSHPLTDQCFARFYNAAHLEHHPRQRVTRFQLRRDRSGPAKENNRGQFTVAVGFRTTDGPDLFTVNGMCTTRGPIAECGGEGDAGHFRLVLEGRNLRVEIDRLELEDSGADLAKSDDQTFLLRPTPARECQG